MECHKDYEVWVVAVAGSLESGVSGPPSDVVSTVTVANPHAATVPFCATVAGSKLTNWFDRDLSSTQTAPSAFSATIDGTARTVDWFAAIGKTAVLNLTTVIAHNPSGTGKVSYTAPAEGGLRGAN